MKREEERLEGGRGGEERRKKERGRMAWLQWVCVSVVTNAPFVHFVRFPHGPRPSSEVFQAQPLHGHTYTCGATLHHADTHHLGGGREGV